MSVYDFIIRNFRGAFIVVLTRGGWFDFGEVVDGSGTGYGLGGNTGGRYDSIGGTNNGIIGLLNIFGTDYVVADAIDIFF